MDLLQRTSIIREDLMKTKGSTEEILQLTPKVIAIQNNIDIALKIRDKPLLADSTNKQLENTLIDNKAMTDNHQMRRNMMNTEDLAKLPKVETSLTGSKSMIDNHQMRRNRTNTENLVKLPTVETSLNGNKLLIEDLILKPKV